MYAIDQKLLKSDRALIEHDKDKSVFACSYGIMRAEMKRANTALYWSRVSDAGQH